MTLFPVSFHCILECHSGHPMPVTTQVPLQQTISSSDLQWVWCTRHARFNILSTEQIPAVFIICLQFTYNRPEIRELLPVEVVACRKVALTSRVFLYGKSLNCGIFLFYVEKCVQKIVEYSTLYAHNCRINTIKYLYF